MAGARKPLLVRAGAPTLARATRSVCGEPLKLRLPSRAPKGRGGQANRLGYGNKAAEMYMGDPQPILYTGGALCAGARTASPGMREVQRLDGRGLAL